MGARAVLNGNLVLVRTLPGWQNRKVNDAQGGSGVKRPTTLAIDIGGTGLKASVLDANGAKIVSRVRTKTPYPCWPRVLVRELDKLPTNFRPGTVSRLGFLGSFGLAGCSQRPTSRQKPVREPHGLASWPRRGQASR